MIRKFEKTDTDRVMEIWLSGNEDAHPFIAKDYWRACFAEVREQILQAELYVCEEDGAACGFIGMTDDYIAGIFVDKACRGRGIGRRLLNCAKEKRDRLTLGVYRKNSEAACFYFREGFVLLSEERDEATGETEYVMVWEREN